MNILREYSDVVEQYSIDEAFVDMTASCHLFGQPEEVAEQIKDYIWERLDFTVNVGVSSNKLLAKTNLATYLEDGRCSFSNNPSENAICQFTVERKNWLFSDTPYGAAASAVVYTIVEMAKAHGLNMYCYLCYLLTKRPDKRWSDTRLSKLAPWD